MAGISGRQNSQRVWMNRKIPAEDMMATLTLMLPGTGDLSVIAMPTTSEGG